MKSVPLFYYPTQVVWVDDDELLLQSAYERYKDIFDIKTYTSPNQCLESLKSLSSTQSSFLKGFKEHENYDLINHMIVDINFDMVCGLRNDNKRFQDVSVIIVDYNMPGKNGIELCNELRDSPIKKILLTGEASYSFAVDAFNKGIIDCFIRKDDPLLATELTAYIKKLQTQYFVDMSSPLLSHLEVDYKLPQSDPDFANFFEQWIKENEINEYYVVDKNGTLLTQNRHGDIRFLITHTDRSLDVFANLYTEDAEVAGYINLVKLREKIPFFGINGEAWDHEFNKWDDYFYSPQCFHGREKYYYSVVEE